MQVSQAIAHVILGFLQSGERGARELERRFGWRREGRERACEGVEQRDGAREGEGVCVVGGRVGCVSGHEAGFGSA